MPSRSISLMPWPASLVGLGLGLLLLWPSCNEAGPNYPWLNLPRSYQSPEARFRIIDARSGLPVEGAWVVLSWEITRPGREGRPFRVVELASQALGEVRVPPWGPDAMPPSGYIPEMFPVFRVFHPGYIVGGGTNTDGERSIAGAAPAVVRIKMDGGEVPLVPRTDDPQLYVDSLKRLYGWLTALKGWGEPPKGSADSATRAVMREIVSVAPEYAEVYSMKEQLESEADSPAEVGVPQ